jgi:hypothetical protein
MVSPFAPAACRWKRGFPNPFGEVHGGTGTVAELCLSVSTPTGVSPLKERIRTSLKRGWLNKVYRQCDSRTEMSGESWPKLAAR